MYQDTDQFGYELIRNDVLKDVLGQEHDSILYWIGKSLARKYPVETSEQLVAFFDKANWGALTLVKERKQEKMFELTGPWMGKHDQRCYQLEAGFLAQQIELSSNLISGATYSTKKESVVFTVETDRHDQAE